MEGVIKTLDGRGYGFIATQKGIDIFFHSSSVVGVKFEDLKVGDPVSFGIEKSRKGNRALRVKVKEAR